MSTKQMLITDIAEKVGVSASTVSRVINNRPGISDRTRVVIIEKMNSLGYSPKPVSSRSGPKHLINSSVKTNVLFLACVGYQSVFKDVFYNTILHSVEDELAKNGMTMIFKRFSHDFDILNLISKSNIGGILIFGNTGLIDVAKIVKLPTVSIIGHFTGHLDVVGYDKSLVPDRVIEYVKHKKQDSIMEMTVTKHSDRLAELAKQNGIKITRLSNDLKEVFIETESMHKPNQDALEVKFDDYLRSNKLPRLIFVHGDMFAVSIYTLLGKKGFIAGKDYEIVSVGNGTLLDSLDPRPAAVDICGKDIGKASVQRLLWRRCHPKERTMKLLFEPELFSKGL